MLKLFECGLLEILVSQLLDLLLVLLLSCEPLAVVLFLHCGVGLLKVFDAPPLFEIGGSSFEVFECDAVALLLVGLGGDEPHGFVVLQLFECGLVLLVDLCQAPILVSLFLLVGVLVQFVLPLLSLVGVAFIEIALALQCFLVVLCHGGVVLFGGDEPLRELHFE